MESEWFKRLFS